MTTSRSVTWRGPDGSVMLPDLMRTVASSAEADPVAVGAWTIASKPIVLTVAKTKRPVSSNLRVREPQAGEGGRWSGSRVGALVQRGSPEQRGR
jgi:hypothetical protein